MIDTSAHRLTPRPGMKPFNSTTQAVLTRLVDLGLRPTYRNAWAHPQPHLSVEFGVGSGWLWGDLLINASGRLCDFRARWTDRDGTEQLDRLDNPRKIREALAAHAEQRQQRIAWLAGSHGLTVQTPAHPDGPTVVQLDVSDRTALADSVAGLDEDTRAALEKALRDHRYTDTRAGVLAQAASVALLAPAVREQIGNAIADAESAERRRLTPGGFPYRQQGHSYGGSNSDRQSVGDPGHCEDCASVGHVIAHPDLGCGDVGCYRHHG